MDMTRDTDYVNLARHILTNKYKTQVKNTTDKTSINLTKNIKTLNHNKELIFFNRDITN